LTESCEVNNGNCKNDSKCEYFIDGSVNCICRIGYYGSRCDLNFTQLEILKKEADKKILNILHYDSNQEMSDDVIKSIIDLSNLIVSIPEIYNDTLFGSLLEIASNQVNGILNKKIDIYKSNDILKISDSILRIKLVSTEQSQSSSQIISLLESKIHNLITNILLYNQSEVNNIFHNNNSTILFKGDAFTFQFSDSSQQSKDESRKFKLPLIEFDGCKSNTNTFLKEDDLKILNSNWNSLLNLNINKNKSEIKSISPEIRTTLIDSKGNIVPNEKCEKFLIKIPTNNQKLIDFNTYKSLYNTSNIDIYDPNQSFFNDICHSYQGDNNTDITLSKRREKYNIQSNCGGNCSYSGFDEHEYSICNCSFLSESFIQSFEKSIFSGLVDSNIYLTLCYDMVFNKNLIFNPGFWCIFSFTILSITGLLVYKFYISKNYIQKYYKEIIYNDGYEDIVHKLTLENDNNIESPIRIGNINLENQEKNHEISVLSLPFSHQSSSQSYGNVQSSIKKGENEYENEILNVNLNKSPFTTRLKSRYEERENNKQVNRKMSSLNSTNTEINLVKSDEKLEKNIINDYKIEYKNEDNKGKEINVKFNSVKTAITAYTNNSNKDIDEKKSSRVTINNYIVSSKVKQNKKNGRQLISGNSNVESLAITNLEMDIFEKNTKRQVKFNSQLSKSQPKEKSNEKIKDTTMIYRIKPKKTLSEIEISDIKTNKDYESLPIQHKIRLSNMNFLSLLKRNLKNRHPYVNILLFHSIKNPFWKRFLSIIFTLSFEFSLNALFYSTSYINEEFDYKNENGSDSITLIFIVINQFSKSFWPIIISILSNIILNLIVYIPKHVNDELNSYLLSKNDYQNQSTADFSFLLTGNRIFQRKMKIRYVIWTGLICIIHFYSWYFVISFCSIYINSNKTWMIGAFISFGFDLSYKFLLCFIDSLLFKIVERYRKKVFIYLYLGFSKVSKVIY
jgi:hypothetical protein